VDVLATKTLGRPRRSGRGIVLGGGLGERGARARIAGKAAARASQSSSRDPACAPTTRAMIGPPALAPGRGRDTGLDRRSRPCRSPDEPRPAPRPAPVRRLCLRRPACARATASAELPRRVDVLEDPPRGDPQPGRRVSRSAQASGPDRGCWPPGPGVRGGPFGHGRRLPIHLRGGGRRGATATDRRRRSTRTSSGSWTAVRRRRRTCRTHHGPHPAPPARSRRGRTRAHGQTRGRRAGSGEPGSMPLGVRRYAGDSFRYRAGVHRAEGRSAVLVLAPYRQTG
jgi:hypothetical protein